MVFLYIFGLDFYFFPGEFGVFLFFPRDFCRKKTRPFQEAACLDFRKARLSGGSTSAPVLGSHPVAGFLKLLLAPRAPSIPSKKVLWGVFRGLNTFLEGIWSPRGLKTHGQMRSFYL